MGCVDVPSGVASRRPCAQRVKMRAAGHQHDLMPVVEQPAADGPAYRTGPMMV
jgi:hypothetical protein